MRHLRIIEKFPRDKLFILRYEDFATNTVRVIEELCKCLNISFDSSTLFPISSNHFSKSEQHVFTGNELITKFRKINEIKKVDLWKINLSNWNKFIFRVFGGEIMNKKLIRLGSKIIANN